MKKHTHSKILSASTFFALFVLVFLGFGASSAHADGVWKITNQATMIGVSGCYYEQECTDATGYADNMFRANTSCSTVGEKATCYFTDSASGCGVGKVQGLYRTRYQYTCTAVSAPACTYDWSSIHSICGNSGNAFPYSRLVTGTCDASHIGWYKVISNAGAPVNTCFSGQTGNGVIYTYQQCEASSSSCGTPTTQPVNNDPTISWSTAPASAACNAQYSIKASGHDQDGNLTAVSIDKDGTAFAYAGGGDGTDGTSGNPTSDAGPKKVTFTAWATDADGAKSATITHTVDIGACAVPNKPPQGTFTASCASLSGTAFDPDSPSTSIGVHFYVDGPAGSGSFVGAVNTNASSKAYTLAVPEALRTNTDRTLYAYGIDAQGGDNPQIGTATIHCAPTPIPAPSGAIAVSPSQFSSSSGGSATITWSVSNATSCTASGDWTGTKATSGTESKSVSRSSTFDISCTGAGGTWKGSTSTTVPGELTITHFFVSPSSVKSGESFVISGGVTWDGVNYLKRHRAYFKDSQGGNWTDASGSYATTLVTNGNYTAEKNPYSMYMGPGSYTVIYEAEDKAGHTVSASRSFTYEGDNRQCSEETHTCSASFSRFEYPKSQSSTDLTIYQSCSISKSAYDALKVPSGTRTLTNTALSSDCPQCWKDTHQYGGTTWYCSRTLGGYEYSEPAFHGTSVITYYTSCTISPEEKQQLINQGYSYDYVQRTNTGRGEWTDVHHMSDCSADYTPPVVPVNDTQTTCNDTTADNFGQAGACSYSNPADTGVPTSTGGGGGVGTGGSSGTGGGGGQLQPGFTVTSDMPTAQIQFLGNTGAASALRTLEVNPVSGFNESVTLSVKSINQKGSTAGLPEDVTVLYSFDSKDFLPNAATVQQFNSSIGGGRYIGEHGTVGSTFRISFSKAVQQSYEVTIQGVSPSGKTAEYILTIDPNPINPAFLNI